MQGVDDQVDEHLSQPLGAALDGRRVAVIFLQFGLVFDLAVDNVQYAFNDFFDLGVFHFVLVVPRESAQVHDDLLMRSMPLRLCSSSLAVSPRT